MNLYNNHVPFHYSFNANSLNSNNNVSLFNPSRINDISNTELNENKELKEIILQFGYSIIAALIKWFILHGHHNQQ